jgi:hypothetical protein
MIPPMKTPSRIAVTCALLMAATRPLHAGFLELRIRETTAESIWHWIIALCAVLIFFTLRASRSKGGQGR